MKPIVYTCVYGDYDDLKDQPDIGADYICFTDNPNLKSDVWEVRYEPIYQHLHPRLRAKFYKLICPFDTLSLFIDGSIEITDPKIIDKLSEYLDNGWATYIHPSNRDCIEKELEASLPMEKYHGHPLTEQVEYYFSQGFPKHYGLWACGVMLRDGRFTNFGSKWMLENLAWSYQDQLSLPYLLWREGFRIDTIPLDQYACFNSPGNELFRIHTHKYDT
jgi:hypothetical protein